eukprot:403375347
MAKDKSQQQQQNKQKNNTKQADKKPSPKEEKSDNKHENVTLMRHPILTIKILIILIGQLIKATFNYVIHHIILILALVSAITAFYQAPGPHEQYRQTVTDFLLFAAWWIGLGIASSVGFGTGLHTFVLYLGPHIAKVTMASNACNFVPEQLPSRWTFHHFKQCEDFHGIPSLPVLTIYQAVIIEAFLWGLGTAIGELPPYYVARAASLAGKKSEEFEEILDEVNTDQSKLPFMERAKVYIYKTLQKNAFVAILLLASVPNPLFDLAGFLCGHFLVPFGVFFGATFIGKAIVKVSIQSFFVIFCFSQHQVDFILSQLRHISPQIQDMLNTAIEKQKKTLFAEKVEDEARPLVAQLWEYFVIAMVLYFVYSIINSLVQNYLNEQDSEEEKQKDTKKKQ